MPRSRSAVAAEKNDMRLADPGPIGLTAPQTDVPNQNWAKRGWRRASSAPLQGTLGFGVKGSKEGWMLVVSPIRWPSAVEAGRQQTGVFTGTHCIINPTGPVLEHKHWQTEGTAKGVHCASATG